MFHNEPQIYKVTVYLVIFTKRFRVKHYKALYKCCILLLLYISMLLFLLFILCPHFGDMSVSTCMLSLASCSDCIIIMPSSAKKSVTILQMIVLIPFRQSYIFSLMRYVTNKKGLLEPLHLCLIPLVMCVIEIYLLFVVMKVRVLNV